MDTRTPPRRTYSDIFQAVGFVVLFIVTIYVAAHTTDDGADLHWEHPLTPDSSSIEHPYTPNSSSETVSYVRSGNRHNPTQPNILQPQNSQTGVRAVFFCPVSQTLKESFQCPLGATSYLHSKSTWDST